MKKISTGTLIFFLSLLSLSMDSVSAIDMTGEWLDPADLPHQASVAMVHKNTPFRVHCSAVRIARDWVMTAAHCLRKPSSALSVDQYYFVLADDNLNESKATLTDPFPERLVALPESQHVHERYDPNRIELGFDIALVNLGKLGDEWLRRGWVPVTEAAEPAEGQVILAGGFGNATYHGCKNSFQHVNDVKTEEDMAAISALESCRNHKRLVRARMDSGLHLGLFPNIAIVNSLDEKKLCFKDSGSGYFRRVGGHWRLFAINGFIPLGFSGHSEVFTEFSAIDLCKYNLSAGTRLEPLKPWILRKMSQGGDPAADGTRKVPLSKDSCPPSRLTAGAPARRGKPHSSFLDLCQAADPWLGYGRWQAIASLALDAASTAAFIGAGSGKYNETNFSLLVQSCPALNEYLHAQHGRITMKCGVDSELAAAAIDLNPSSLVLDMAGIDDAFVSKVLAGRMPAVKYYSFAHNHLRSVPKITSTVPYYLALPNNNLRRLQAVEDGKLETLSLSGNPIAEFGDFFTASRLPSLKGLFLGLEYGAEAGLMPGPRSLEINLDAMPEGFPQLRQLVISGPEAATGPHILSVSGFHAQLQLVSLRGTDLDPSFVKGLNESGLSDLRLGNISIGGRPASPSDLSLQSMPALKSLSLGVGTLSDLDFLAHAYPVLETLELRGPAPGLTDMDGLYSFQGALRNLVLNGLEVPLDRLSGTDAFSGLTSLSIHQDAFADLSPLKSAVFTETLATLILSGTTPIADLSPLSSLRNLQHLVLGQWSTGPQLGRYSAATCPVLGEEGRGVDPVPLPLDQLCRRLRGL